MMTTDTIAQLVQANGGAAVLDRIHLPYADPKAGPAAKFGLGAELYLPDIDRSLLREHAAEFLYEFWSMFPDQVNEFLQRDTKRAKRFKGDPRAAIEADIANYAAETGYSGALFGRVDIGLPNDDVPPYQANLLVNRAGDPGLSFFHANMPLASASGQLHTSMLLERFVGWCQRFRPLHGSAGFAIIVCPGMGQNSVYALQLMTRFPGFDFPTAVDFTLEVDDVHDRIKSVNWLTALGDELVAQLGGLATMREALEPACTVHAYDGGVVIQAGPTPRLGDTHADDIPAEYRLAARFTRPVRFEDYDEGLFRVPKDLDKRAETLKWIRRFD
ncbi:type VI immunity family protein [Roseateles sp.]|uniref:type VI immunity family protein n=1 Tax=Roseateles sp. TaxID=1971397 RepID=UPI0031DF19C2